MDSQNEAQPARLRSTLRPELETSIADARPLCGSLGAGDEANTSGYTKFLARVLELYHRQPIFRVGSLISTISSSFTSAGQRPRLG